jgi:hypothetical protein
MGLSSVLTRDSTSDETLRHFSKPSASSPHQIKHIHGSGSRPSVPGMGGWEQFVIFRDNRGV